MDPSNFFRRYWLLVLLFALSFFVSWTDVAFGIAGAFVYLPVSSFGAMILAVGLRRVFYRKTLDDDAHSGYFVYAWCNLTQRDRVFANLFVMAVLFIGICMIAAALIK